MSNELSDKERLLVQFQITVQALHDLGHELLAAGREIKNVLHHSVEFIGSLEEEANPSYGERAAYYKKQVEKIQNLSAEPIEGEEHVDARKSE